MELKEYYGTLSQTINALVELGYSLDFNIKEECLVCNKTNTQLSSDDFQIDKLYRFEGMTDPEDQSILYAISSTVFNVKGLLVNSYGMDSDEYSSKLIAKLHTPLPSNNKSNTPIITAEETISELNLSELVSSLKSSEKWLQKEVVTLPIFKSQGMNIILLGMKANAELKTHTAKGVISLQVLIGEVVFAASGKSTTISKDKMITLAAGIPHSLQALPESFLILTLGN